MSLLIEKYTSSAVVKDNNLANILNWAKFYFKKSVAVHLPTNKDIKILDLGCGYGANVMALSELGYQQVSGVDLSPEQCKMAQEEFHLKNIYQNDILIFLDEVEPLSVDVVFLLDVIEHLEREYLVALFVKLTKILKEDGRVIIQAPNGISIFNPIIYGDLTHLRAFTTDSLKQLGVATGFSSCNVFEAKMPVRGFSSFVRRLIWDILFKNLFRFYFTVVHAQPSMTIFSPNLIAVFRK